MDATRQPLAVALTLFGLLLALFWSRWLSFPLPIEQPAGPAMPLGVLIDGSVAGSGLWVAVGSALVVFINALLLTRIGTRSMLYTTRSFMPMTLYVLVSCGVFIPSQSLSAMLAGFLFIRGFDLIIQGFRRAAAYDLCFTGCLLAGTAPLLYAPYALAAPVLLLTLPAFFRSAREQLVALIGLVLPMAICCYVYWGMGESFIGVPVMLWETITQGTRTSLITTGDLESIASLTCMGIMVFLLLLSVAAFFVSGSGMRTRPYRIFIALLVLIIPAAAACVLPVGQPAVFQLVSLPFTLLVPLAFKRFPGAFSAILYTLLIISLAVLNLIRIFF